MTAKELRLEDEGIQVTGFEAPRRMEPEIARQQCFGCQLECQSECPLDCNTECDSDCWNLCIGDDQLVATYVAHPRALTQSTGNTRVAASYHAAEY